MSAANQNQLAPVSPILSGAAIGAAQSLQGLVFPFLPIQPVVPTASKGTREISVTKVKLPAVTPRRSSKNRSRKVMAVLRHGNTRR